MTVTTETRSVTYTGDGFTTSWPFAFEIPEASHLNVQTFDTVTLATVVVDAADYSVSGIGDAGGGTVIYPTSAPPLPTTTRITLKRSVPFTQGLDISNQGGFFPEVFEDQLDLIVMQIQQIAEGDSLNVRGPVGDLITDFTLPFEEARKSKYFFFDSTGAPDVTGTAPPTTLADFDTKAAAEAATVPSAINTIRIAGYTAFGDGGGGVYKDVAGAEPSHELKLQTGDGVWWELLPDSQGAINIMQAGASTGAADNTVAIQAVLDFFAAADRDGGTVVLGNGRFTITGTLIPKSEGITITGTGRRNAQLALVEGDMDVPSTLFKTGTGAAIDLDTQFRINGFLLEKLTLLGAAADKANITGVRIRINGPTFRRDFQFDRLCITGFDAAWNAFRETAATEPAIGVVVIQNCMISKNNHIWEITGTTEPVINGFRFINNDAGQNSSGTDIAIELKAHAITITGNILEGQSNPIFCSDAHRSMIIEGNYFESNTGTACIDLISSGTGRVGPNFYASITADYQVRALDTFGMTFEDPVILNRAMMPRLRPYRQFIGGQEGTLNFPTDAAVANSRIVLAGEESLGKQPDLLYSTAVFTENTREEWIDGRLIVAELNSVSGTGLLSFLFSTASAAVGEWVVVSIACKYIDAPTALHTAMRVNDSGAAANGSTAGNWGRPTHIPTDEWMIITQAIRVRVTLTSHMAYFYPFGISPAGSSDVLILNPSLHVVTQPEFVRPAIDIRRHQQVASAAPSAGTWKKGDSFDYRSPNAGGKRGTICTTLGTPGVWDDYGVIDA